jgi:hypothetical protein
MVRHHRVWLPCGNSSLTGLAPFTSVCVTIADQCRTALVFGRELKHHTYLFVKITTSARSAMGTMLENTL